METDATLNSGIKAPRSPGTGQKRIAKSKDSKKPTPSKRLLGTNFFFLNDIECLRDMFHTVVPILVQTDKQRRSAMSAVAKRLAALTEKKKPDKNELLNEVMALTEAARKLDRANLFFRSNSIISLVARYEEFFRDLTQTIFEAHPDRLKSQDRTINYEEAIALGSIDELKAKFIEKEVDRISKQPFDDQFRILKALTGVSCEELKVWPRFIEVLERRHVHAHCGGCATPKYIRVCKEYKVQIDPSITVGKYLRVDENYFEQAYSALFEVGFFIGQGVYRKIFPKDLVPADETLVDIGVRLLQAEQWDLAATVFAYGVGLPPHLTSDDNHRRVFLINNSIALKFSGRAEEARSLVKSVDWTAADEKFNLAVAVLGDDFARAERIMSQMKKDRPVREWDYRTWPLFREFRVSKEFQRGFRKVFKKDFAEISKEDVNKQLPAEGPA